MHIATIEGQLIIAEYLIGIGLDVNAADDNGVTILHYAISENSRPNDTKPTKEIIFALLKHGADPNGYSFDFSFLYKVSYYGYDEILNVIIKKIININEVNNEFKASALHAASENGHLDIILSLLNKGADITIININNFTAYDLAPTKEIAKILSSPITRLISAAANSQFEKLEPLLSRVDINSANHFHNTALNIAAEKNLQQMAIFLLDHGAQNKADPLCYTPLHTAALNKNYPMMDLLVGYGAQLYKPNFLGHNALDYAKEYNSAKLLGNLTEVDHS